MFKGLKKFLMGSSAEILPLDEDKKEERFHPRWNLEAFPFLRVEYPKAQFLRAKDLSYGGVSLAKPDFRTLGLTTTEVRGQLHLFDKTCAFKARVVHEDNQQMGFQFIHDTGDVLLFLRSFLEDFRCGALATVLHPSILKESFRETYNLALRGDGPFDLYIDYKENVLQTALMTQRSNQDYQEVRLNKGVLQTGRALDEQGAAPRVLADAKVDPEVLKKSLQILAGTQSSVSSNRPAIEAFQKYLETELIKLLSPLGGL